ncbi:Hypothetical predicted protein [Olea europaea subsp. europaea]|uniref:Uncharacterized protein n=1 Tax=Olea europaea subsp. europaea TaxID=158383 RepID=A0A8S0T468_OLEEU|nr:Hypothetical predicted protein [Olea europaea subsp. europaea]
MTAAKGVCKAVSEVVTKPSSYQIDMPKPDSNGISHHNDPDNSNAFMNGSNGLSEDLVVNNDVVELDSSVLTDSEVVEVQGVEFDAQSGKLDSKSAEISELLDGEHDAVEGTSGIFAVENIPQDQQNSLGTEGLGVANGILPVENCNPQDQQNSLGGEGHDFANEANGNLPVKNGIPQDQQNSLWNGVEVQDAATDAMEVQVGKTENGAAVEIKQVQGQTGKTESNAEDEIELVQEQSGETKRNAEDEVEQVQDQTGNTERNAEDEIEQIQEQSGKTESSVEDKTASNGEDEIEPVQDQIGKTESNGEDEIEPVQDQTGKTEGNAEDEIEQVQDQSGNTESNGEDEIEPVQDQTGKTESSVEDEIEQVQDQTGKTESSAEDEIEPVQNQTGKTESSVEDEIELVQDQTGKTESNAEDEIEPVQDQSAVQEQSGKTESSAEDEIEQFQDQNEETESLVKAEIEKVEDWTKSESCSSVIENQESQVGLGTQLAEDAVECEIRKVEVGEMSSEEVPVTTSMYLDPKSWPLINEEKTKRELESEKSQMLFSRRWADMVKTPSRKTIIVHDHAFKVNKENFPLPPRHEEPAEHPDCSEESPKAVKSEILIDVCQPTDNFSASISEPREPQLENYDAKSTDEVSSSSSDGLRLKINVENVPIVNNIILGCTTNDANESEDNGNGISTAPPKGSTDVMLARENLSVGAATRPFYLVRIPKSNDRKLREQIKHAQLEVDEKTRLRNVIQLEIQKTRENYRACGSQCEAAMIERGAARKIMRSKLSEIDFLRSVINRAKSVITIEDLDRQICNMEHMIQHETLTLKEEKQLIHEIKQVKQHRDKLSHSIGSQDEIQQALDQREEAEERLKILKKELDGLKDSISKIEEAATAAGREREDENRKAEELRVQFRAADDIRQAAYSQLQSLRKELFEENEHFRKYMGDAATARDCAFNEDREGLHHLCVNQVEKIMKLWNTNDKFRKEYVKQNERSTLTRFGTLDGLSLGHDKVPPNLPGYVNEGVGKLGLTPVETGSIQSSPLELSEPKNRMMTNKEPAKPVLVNALATVSGEDVINEIKKKPMKSKEEVELERKMEEESREEAKAKLKEQLRLEEIEKTKLALERKKRNAEKAQRRAEQRAQKEVEQKEKEREKRLKKKERKNASAAAPSEVNDVSRAIQSTEIQTEIVEETNSVAAASTRRPPKQSKSKYNIPPSIVRNRNKRKWQPWIWLVLACLTVVALFLLGNTGMFTNANHKWW